MGKPFTYETAFKTIMRFSGKNVFFNTGVVIISQNKGIDLSYIDQTIIAFKPFKDTDLIQYLDSQDDFRTTAGVKTESTVEVKSDGTTENKVEVTNAAGELKTADIDVKIIGADTTIKSDGAVETKVQLFVR